MLRPVDLTQETQPKTTLGCPVLDGFLRGGIPCGVITELTGEASAGKTQLVLQSLLTVQLPESEGGLSGKAVYIYTEGKPPIERLQSICASRFGSRSDVSLAHVLIEERPIASPDDLMRSVRQLEGLLEREAAAAAKGPGQAAAQGGHRQVRLVVIDSVARVFRDAGEGADAGEPQVQQLQRRTALLFGLATLLKRLARQHGLAVLLTNQVMDDINHETGALEVGLPSTLRTLQQPGAAAPGLGGSRAAALVSSGRRVLPALGLAWANCVNCRLFVARHEGASGSVIRTLQVVFAPHLPYSYCCFSVTHDGVWGVAEDDEGGEQAAAEARAVPVRVPTGQQPLYQAQQAATW